MSKINTARIKGKIRVRILRPWRGYPVGSVISPPAGMRQMLLQAKDRMGKPVAEVIEATDEPAPPVFAPVAVPEGASEAAPEDAAPEEPRHEKHGKSKSARKGHTPK
jgi:hypothetical protein